MGGGVKGYLEARLSHVLLHFMLTLDQTRDTSEETLELGKPGRDKKHGIVCVHVDSTCVVLLCEAANHACKQPKSFRRRRCVIPTRLLRSHCTPRDDWCLATPMPFANKNFNLNPNPRTPWE